MKKVALLLLILLQSCNKDNPVVYETHVDISVLDEKENDLLNPDSDSSESININEIKIYYVIDGKEVLYYEELSHSPNGYRLLDPEFEYKNYRLRIFINALSKTDITETIIQWDKERRDIIKAKINRKNNTTYITKIWLNEKVVWNNEGVLFFEIRK